VITGSETWPLSFDPSSLVPMIAVLTLLHNADTTTPISGSAVSTGTGTGMTAAGITATNSHTVTMTLFANADSSNNNITGATAGTAWDDMVYNHNGSTYVNVGFSHDIATTTTTGTPSWLLGASKSWIATSVAINPAPDTFAINANLSWTASSTTWATGYTWERWTTNLQQTGTVTGAPPLQPPTQPS
jgi:hypothetical protein